MNSWQWYVSQFPECMFLCASKHKNEYVENVIRGKDIAAQSNVLICGIARNCEKILPYTIARIERLGSLFRSYHVYIYENDSIDQTLSLLNNWKKENRKITIKSETLSPPPFTDPKGEVRLKYMAAARNNYLAYAKQYNKKKPVDYLIFVDCDLRGGWSYDGVLNSIGQDIEWHGIGSNSLCYISKDNEWTKLFYDQFAFRSSNSWQEIDKFANGSFVFNRGEPLVSVNSCFGGLCIYKPSILETNVKYTQDDCDHVTFNKQLIEKYNYKIFINPSQISLYNKI